ncbi:LicD family protein [Clostridium tertium]|uniref:LicD family protein n=1 Tax=Clostridium tertium TaxID=1559 RepID=UPI00232DB05A|nr:LicD family protein [Clostridium tertium]MDB1921737.1 LicD family protein [Clostridium tertium]MDB1924940.1 LicD family protein [Clostridium tertium]MDB1929579.1 LicD family protein [Clostridium tertium]
MKKASIREAQMRMLEILIEIDKICKKNNINYWLDSGTLLGAIRHNGFIPWDDDLDIGMLREDYVKFLDVVNNELNKKYICQTPDSDKYCKNAFIKIRDTESKIENRVDNINGLGVFVDIFPYDYLTKKNIIIKKFFNFIILSNWGGNLKLKKPCIKNMHKNIIICFCKLANLFYKVVPIEGIIRKIYRIALKNKIIESKKIMYGIEVPFKEIIDKSDVFPLKMHMFEGREFPVPNNFENILKILFNEWYKLPPKEFQVPSHSEEIYIK